jgi:DNA polymerase I
MLDAFIAGCDFHSRIAMNMYQHIRETIEEEKVILEWHPQPDQEKPLVLLLKVCYL